MTSRLLTVPLLVVSFLLSLFVLPALDSPLVGTNLFTVLTILILLYGDTRLSVIAGSIGGLCFDLYSPYPYGSLVFGYLVTFLVIRRLFATRITNRSLIAYTTLAMTGTLCFHLATQAYRYGISFIDAGALGIHPDTTLLTLVISDTIRTVLIALLVYALVRLSGRSYATLISHDF